MIPCGRFIGSGHWAAAGRKEGKGFLFYLLDSPFSLLYPPWLALPLSAGETPLSLLRMHCLLTYHLHPSPPSANLWGSKCCSFKIVLHLPSFIQITSMQIAINTLTLTNISPLSFSKEPEAGRPGFYIPSDLWPNVAQGSLFSLSFYIWHCPKTGCHVNVDRHASQ